MNRTRSKAEIELLRARLLEAARKNPDLTCSVLAERLSIRHDLAWRWLKAVGIAPPKTDGLGRVGGAHG